MPSINLDVHCMGCGATASANFGEAVVAERAVWNLGYLCAACGESVELDGHCPAPDEWRSRMLGANGTWQITLAGKLSSRELTVVRSLMSWTLAELTGFRDARNRLLAEGTRAEMEALRVRLESEGLTATVSARSPD